MKLKVSFGGLIGKFRGVDKSSKSCNQGEAGWSSKAVTDDGEETDLRESQEVKWIKLGDYRMGLVGSGNEGEPGSKRGPQLLPG